MRLALWALPPFAGAALALPALLDVFQQADEAPAGAATLRAILRTSDHVADVSLLVCAGVLAVGLALAALDRRTDRPGSASHAARTARGRRSRSCWRSRASASGSR